MKPLVNLLVLALGTAAVGPGATAGAADAAAQAQAPVAQAATPASIEAGRQLYQRWCLSCHAAGPGHPGTTALDALYKGAVPSVLEQGTSLDATAIAYFVRNGRSTMPTFRKSEIDDRELDDIAAYLTARKPKAAQHE